MFKVYEFHWKAVNRFQQQQKGKILAKSRDEVENKLLKKGYANIKINRNFVFAAKPKQEEITQVITQLALLFNANIPLKTSLQMMIDSCQNTKLYIWLNGIISLIDTGYSFSYSLDKLKRYFSYQEIQLIKMGEISGNLSMILSNIAEARNKSDKLRQKIKKILFYPVVVLAISLLLSLFLLIFIVPQFAQLYSAKDKSLPFITELLFVLSKFFQGNVVFLLISLVFISVLLIFLDKKTAIVKKLKLFILTKMPVFAQIIQYSRIVFFTQSLSLMLNSGVKLDKALASFLSEQSNDPVLEREITLMLSLLQQGYRFYEGLNPTIFHQQVVKMIAVGEQSGNLSKMLEYVSNIYQQKLDYQIDILSQLLEPMLMLVMGVIVGTIIVGLYLPIFDMGAIVE